MGDPSKGLSAEFSLMLNSSIKPYVGNYTVTCACMLDFDTCIRAVCQLGSMTQRVSAESTSTLPS